MDRTYQALVIFFIINFCFLGYSMFNYINKEVYPDNIPENMVFNELDVSLKSIDVKIQSYEGSLMQIQDGDNIITFPSNWTDGLKEINLVDCNNLSLEIKFCNKSPQSMGTYYIKNKSIIMRTGLSESDFNITVIHEIGHHIWYTQLNDSFKEGWCDNYEKQTDYITGYSYSECTEDFAEAFRVYYLDGKVMEHELSLFEEIEEVMFGGE